MMELPERHLHLVRDTPPETVVASAIQTPPENLVPSTHAKLHEEELITILSGSLIFCGLATYLLDRYTAIPANTILAKELPSTFRVVTGTYLGGLTLSGAIGASIMYGRSRKAQSPAQP